MQELYLFETQITDAGLAYLQGLTNLEKLHLMGTEVTDAGLSTVEKMKGLKWLDLRLTRITDAGLAHLRGLEHLRDLDLYGSAVTREGVVQFQQALPNCTNRRAKSGVRRDVGPNARRGTVGFPTHRAARGNASTGALGNGLRSTFADTQFLRSTTQEIESAATLHLSSRKRSYHYRIKAGNISLRGRLAATPAGASAAELAERINALATDFLLDVGVGAGTSGEVYFIEAVGAERVKIGVSGDVDKRFGQLAASFPGPLRLLGKAPDACNQRRSALRL